MSIHDALQSQVLDLLHGFREKKGAGTPTGTLGSTPPLQLSVRAAIGHRTRPMPLLTIWGLALFFVSLILIPDLNRKLMSIPVPPASLLTAEVTSEVTSDILNKLAGASSTGSRKLGGSSAETGHAAAEGEGGSHALSGQAASRKVMEENSQFGHAEQKQPEGHGRQEPRDLHLQAGDGVSKKVVAKKDSGVKVMGSEEEVFWLGVATDGGGGDSVALDSTHRSTQSGTLEGKLRLSASAISGVKQRKLKESVVNSEAQPGSDATGDSLLGEWPNKIILALATGYSLENVSVLVRTFQKNVGGARLVLFVEDKSPIRGWTPHKGVVIQPFHKPEAGLWSRLPLWLVRFRLFRLFLDTVMEQKGDKRHSTVIFCDSRDVAFLGDPFPLYRNSTSVYLFQESTSFPDRGAKKLSNNHKWVAACYGPQDAYSLAGQRVVNAGFMAGTFQAMSKLAGAVVREAESLPIDGCLGNWGSDQAIVNHLVRSGLLRQSVPFILEDNDHGAVLQRFSRKAVVQVATTEDAEGAQPVLRNKEGRAVFVIHGYDRFSDTLDVVKQISQ